MPKWNLKQLSIKNGKPTLGPVTVFEGSKEAITYVKKALEVAATSACTKPIFSGFHVKGLITSGHSNVSPLFSGNVEYGYCHALHNEEMAVASLISLTGTSEVSGHRILTIVAGQGKGSLKNLAMPCGNCRDILRDVIGENCLIVSGTADGGLAIVAKLSDLLFDRYTSIGLASGIGAARREIGDLLIKGKRLDRDAYNQFRAFPLRKYLTKIVTLSDNSLGESEYIGAVNVPADFHTTYPLCMAILKAQQAEELIPKRVVIVAEGDGEKPPDVMYRDRQHLLEFVFEAELLLSGLLDGGHLSLPIHLFTTTARGTVTGAWQTRTDEWLPFPFSPRNFGKEFLEQRRQELMEKYR